MKKFHGSYGELSEEEMEYLKTLPFGHPEKDRLFKLARNRGGRRRKKVEKVISRVNGLEETKDAFE